MTRGGSKDTDTMLQDTAALVDILFASVVTPTQPSHPNSTQPNPAQPNRTEPNPKTTTDLSVNISKILFQYSCPNVSYIYGQRDMSQYLS